MAKVKPVPNSHHHRASVFVSSNFKNCAHVFVRRDAVMKPLQPPYDGPFHVIKRFEKYYTLEINGRETNVSLDRLEPAFMLKDDPATHDHGYATRNSVKRKNKSVHFSNY